MEAEVAVLKSLDLASVAEIHLYKSLLKTKSIATAPAFPHHVRATIDASKKPQETASANVQARLFKSGPVRAAMTEALKGIRAVLDIEELKPNGKKRVRAKDYADGSVVNDTTGPAGLEKDGSSMPTILAPNEEEWSGLSAQESLENDEDQGLHDDSDGDEDEEEENVDYNLYASRLARSSDEDSMGEEPAGQDHDRDELNDMSITDEELSEEESHDEEGEEEDHDPSDDSGIEDNNQPSDKPIPKNKPKHPQPPTAPPKTTTFLPSLSLTGYWSGSDTSHPSSDNESSAAQIQVRKNRMGQQARRALWEKKFGQNANHVKKQARVQDRDQGWDARKGAQGVGDERGKRGRGRGRGGVGRGLVDARRGSGGRFAKSTGANSDPVVAKAKAAAAEGPLHPSWEAARKAKEQKKVMPFQGKKVVFD